MLAMKGERAHAEEAGETMSARFGAALLGAVLVLAPALVRADTAPSRWERARDPDAAGSPPSPRSVHHRCRSSR